MKNPYHNDIWLYRIVVAVLDLTGVVSVAGAISGLLAPSPVNR